MGEIPKYKLKRSPNAPFTPWSCAQTSGIKPIRSRSSSPTLLDNSLALSPSSSSWPSSTELRRTSDHPDITLRTAFRSFGSGISCWPLRYRTSSRWSARLLSEIVGGSNDGSRCFRLNANVTPSQIVSCGIGPHCGHSISLSRYCSRM
jgi:hypothetical protein